MDLTCYFNLILTKDTQLSFIKKVVMIALNLSESDQNSFLWKSISQKCLKLSKSSLCIQILVKLCECPFNNVWLLLCNFQHFTKAIKRFNKGSYYIWQTNEDSLYHVIIDRAFFVSVLFQYLYSKIGRNRFFKKFMTFFWIIEVIYLKVLNIQSQVLFFW